MVWTSKQENWQTVSLSAATHLHGATFGIVYRNTEICAKYLKSFIYLFRKSQPLHRCGQLLFVYTADTEMHFFFLGRGGGIHFMTDFEVEKCSSQ